MVQASDRVRNIKSTLSDTYAYVSPEANQDKFDQLNLMGRGYRAYREYLPSFITFGSCSESKLDQTTDQVTENHQIWTMSAS